MVKLLEYHRRDILDNFFDKKEPFFFILVGTNGYFSFNQRSSGITFYSPIRQVDWYWGFGSIYYRPSRQFTMERYDYIMPLHPIIIFFILILICSGLIFYRRYRLVTVAEYINGWKLLFNSKSYAKKT